MAVVLSFPLWVMICSKLSIQCSPIVFNRRFYRPVKRIFYISVHEGLLPCRDCSLIGRLVGYCKRSTKSIVGDAVGEQRDELLKEISAEHN